MAISSRMHRAHLPEHHNHRAPLERLPEPESSAASEEGDGSCGCGARQQRRRGAGPTGLRPVSARHPSRSTRRRRHGRLKDRRGSGSGDSYKVLLIDDAHRTEKLVEKALPQVVPPVTAEQARQLFHEPRQKGTAALVIVAVKEHAEFYAQMMVRQGLRSSIEPESDMAT